MAYHYTYKRFIKKKMGVIGIFLKTIKYIKPEDSENLTKITTHDKPTSLIKGICQWHGGKLTNILETALNLKMTINNNNKIL